MKKKNSNKKVSNKVPIQKVVKKSSKTRVPTGISGFDKLIQGGLPKNSSTLVVAGPGCGKTIFCMQYLYKGAKEFGEKGLYITFEQTSSSIRQQARQFGWNFKELEKKGLIEIMSIPVTKLNKKTIKEIEERVKEKGIKRLVIDSLSTLVINAPIYVNTNDMSMEDVVDDNVVLSPPVVGDYLIKKFVYSFVEKLRNFNTTTLLVGEADQEGATLTRDSLSEFACDGIISITFESLGGEFSRSLIVRKMRHTNNNEDIHPMEIGKHGIVVHDVE
ncbi:MAG: RAD55 family ATPase [Nanoarchaeota archaeon]